MLRVIGRASAIVCMSSAMFAQSPAKPSIEVATIKPNKSGGPIWTHFDPERMIWTGVQVSVLIQEAYNVRSYQIVGGPVWIGSDSWDINVKTEGPTGNREKMLLLQSLLADRFQLRFHRETREMKAYKLVVAKSGPKLHEVKDGDPGSGPGSTRVDRGLLKGRSVSVSDLARFLQSELGRPVEDGTGLTGKYDYKLEWVPDESQPNSGGEAPLPGAEGPTIFSAIQEQLGLKLEATKGSGEVMVIDHAEKPGGN
jgi:uncharacterized protein (TIGR03435 family)